MAELFNAPDPLRVVFGPNVTEALNLALHGLLQPGDHVITSSMEHNSVMRPLRDAGEAGRGADRRALLHPTARWTRRWMRGGHPPQHAPDRPQPRLQRVRHAPARAEGGRDRPRATACSCWSMPPRPRGAYPIDMQADSIDLLAFTGHKSLYGPTGTGGLVIGERVDAQDLHH